MAKAVPAARCTAMCHYYGRLQDGKQRKAVDQ